MKRCNKCGQEKPLDCFYAHRQCKDGHVGTCKECYRSAGKRRYEEHREEHLAKCREYRDEHREEIRAYFRKRYSEKRDELCEYQRQHRPQINARKRERRESNREAYNAYQRDYYSRTREQYAARSKRYREEHRESIRQWRKEFRVRNAERIAEQKRASFLRSVQRDPSIRERINQKHRERYATDPEYRRRRADWVKRNIKSVMVAKYRNRQVRMNAVGSFTAQEWKRLLDQTGHICLACGRPESEVKLTPDHVVPLARGGTGYIDNIQPLCLSCNCRKNAKTIDYRVGVTCGK